MEMINQLRLFCIVGFFIFFAVHVDGQITSSSANVFGIAEYNSEVTVFLFDNTVSASIEAVNQNVGTTYHWRKFDADSNSWSETTETSGVLSSLDLGMAYELTINEGLVDEAKTHCWVFSTPVIGDLSIAIDETVNVCTTTKFDITHDYLGSLKYVNPIVPTKNYSIVNFEVEWNVNDQNLVDAKSDTPTIIVSGAPYKDVGYTINIADIGGRVVGQKSDLFIAKNVKAIYTIETAEGEDSDFELQSDSHLGGDTISLTRSSKWKADFVIDSTDQHIDHFEWVVDIFDHNNESIEEGVAGEAASHVFSEVGVHKISMRVVNNTSQCEDTHSDYSVKIFNSVLWVPNAFFPSGDVDEVKKFKVVYHSIVEFDMVVYNRWGREVFASTDPDEGWNGKIGGTLAAPGVYFYVVEAIGADGYKHNKNGAVHLMPRYKK